MHNPDLILSILKQLEGAFEEKERKRREREQQENKPDIKTVTYDKRT